MKKFFIFVFIITTIILLLSGCGTSDDHYVDDSYVFEFDLKENIYYSVFMIDSDSMVKEYFRTGSQSRSLTDNEQNELNKLLSESELKEVQINDNIIGDGMYFELNGDNALLLGVKDQLYYNINNTTYLVVNDFDVRDYVIKKYFGNICGAYSRKYDNLINIDNNIMLFDRYFYKIDNKENLKFFDTEKSYTKEINENEALEIAKKEIDKNPHNKYNKFTVYRDIKNEYYGVLAGRENVLDYEMFIVMDKYGNLIYMK